MFLRHPEILLIINQGPLSVQRKHFIHVIYTEPDFKINSGSQTQGMSPLFLVSTLTPITLKPEFLLFTQIRSIHVQVLLGKISLIFTQVIVKFHSFSPSFSPTKEVLLEKEKLYLSVLESSIVLQLQHQGLRMSLKTARQLFGVFIRRFSTYKISPSIHVTQSKYLHTSSCLGEYLY